MELFLLVSMALTIVSFSLIVLSEPAAPSLVEHDSDFATEYAHEENIVEMREAVVPSMQETATPQTAIAMKF